MGTVRQEVTRIEGNVFDAYAAAGAKGASLPSTQNIANLASTINTIESQADANDYLCNYKVDLTEVMCSGGCVQSGTPTPSNPVGILCNNGEIKINNRTNEYNNHIPDNIEILDSIYFAGGLLNPSPGYSAPYINTGLNFNDPSSSTRATDWKKIAIEIKAKMYNHTLGSAYKQLFVFGKENTTGNDVFGSIALEGIETSSGVNAKFHTWTYNQQSNTLSARNSEHICRFSMRLSDGRVFIYDEETETTLVDTHVTINSYSIPSSDADPRYVMIGSPYSSYLTDPEMDVYNVKITSTTDGSVLYDGVPARNYNTGEYGLYDKISGRFSTGTSGTIPLTGYNRVSSIFNTIGAQETIEDISGNTSSCDALLSLDSTIEDVQKLKEGIINRKIGIKFLDGTETWTYANQASYGNTAFSSTNAITTRALDKRFALCTHFQNSNIESDLLNNGYMFLDSASQKISFCNTAFSTPSDFASWLANRYAANSPVMVIYPLVSDFDFSVASQQNLQTTPLTQTAGSISNLPIDTYKKIIQAETDVTNKLQNIEIADSYSLGYLLYWDPYHAAHLEPPMVTGALTFIKLKSIKENAFQYAFAGCDLTSVSFPALTYVENFGRQAFWGADIGTVAFDALQEITNAGGFSYTFYQTNTINSVSFPVLHTISGNLGFAFAESKLANIYFPSLENITSEAFYFAFQDCTLLTTIEFPKLTNVTSNNAFLNAFSGCTNLTSIHFKNDPDVQQMIESLNGYSSKFGASNATIYFDL